LRHREIHRVRDDWLVLRTGSIREGWGGTAAERPPSAWQSACTILGADHGALGAVFGSGAASGSRATAVSGLVTRRLPTGPPPRRRSPFHPIPPRRHAHDERDERHDCDSQ
jgi:hypothetical protein